MVSESFHGAFKGVVSFSLCVSNMSMSIIRNLEIAAIELPTHNKLTYEDSKK